MVLLRVSCYWCAVVVGHFARVEYLKKAARGVQLGSIMVVGHYDLFDIILEFLFQIPCSCCKTSISAKKTSISGR